LKRTLVSLYEDAENDLAVPLIDIEPHNIIPDEMHLLLRITDVMTENLIIAVQLHDKQQNRGCKLLDGPMIKWFKALEVVELASKYGEKRQPCSKEFEFTSLMGNCKKKLLDKLPPKLKTCQLESLVEDVTELWKV